VILLTVKIEDIPFIEPEERTILEKMPHEFYRLTMRYGFKDELDIPADLARCQGCHIEVDAMDVSYFIGKENLIAKHESDMGYWRQKLFVGMFRNADSVTNHFKLPPNRVVELGAQLTL
jgi:KUP system potassium uptake protein